MNRNALIGIAVAALLAYLMTRRSLTPSVTIGEWFDTEDYAPGSTSYPEGLKNFARAIAHAEGFGVPGAIPTICNNPGDLKLGGDTINGITVFSSADEGWSRLYRQIALIVNGGSAYYNLDMSIIEMGAIYANEPGETVGGQRWASNVANYLGVAPTAKLWEVIV